MSGHSQPPRILGFPGRYVQGPGALRSLGALVREVGCERPVLVSDDVVDAALGTRVPDALAAASLRIVRLRFPGECTHAAIAALSDEARAAMADVVIALGGGKTIDAAKGIARTLGTRLVIVPTVASNDSPTSRLIVVYDDAHRLVGVDFLARNPDAVLVDTEVIVRAPVRFFRAGIGDAISKRYEAAQCARAGGLNFFGGRPPDTALLLAEHCHATLVAHGESAIEAVGRHACTPAVESVIEATVLLSGLGFESGGLSLSHALLRGLSALPELAGALHGEQVAFGTIVQLVLEGRPDAELRAHVDLLVRLGLPTTLAALGWTRVSDAQLAQVASLTLAAPYIGNFQSSLSAEAIAAAIVLANTLGTAPARLQR